MRKRGPRGNAHKAEVVFFYDNIMDIFLVNILNKYG